VSYDTELVHDTAQEITNAWWEDMTNDDGASIADHVEDSAAVAGLVPMEPKVDDFDQAYLNFEAFRRDCVNMALTMLLQKISEELVLSQLSHTHEPFDPR
jgi:hypothetical protein